MKSATALSLLLLALVAAAAEPQKYDLILRGGRIIDGSGNPWYRADVAVKGDRIAAIAPRLVGSAGREIPAEGLVVAPGFIDLHTHARRGIFQNPGADNYVRQGVTTIFEGPDGDSPLPIAAFLERIEAADTAPNVGMFIGHGSVREKVIGRVDRAATPDELDRMRAMVREGMVQGAFGLSTGLFYAPGVFSRTEEVVELAKVAGALGGIHISHMRNEAAGVVDSVRETIRIGEEGRLPTQVTHHKVMGKTNAGKSRETLRLLAEARARGVDATSDQYPYTASSTSLASGLLPSWANEGGRRAMLARLTDPAQRERIRDYVREAIRLERGGGDPKNIQIAWAENDPAIQGKNLAEIMREHGVEPTVANAAETVLQLLEKGQVRGIFHAISEPDLEAILADPTTMIASDGEVAIFGKASPHPRSYGTFPRVLGVYVREKKLLKLEDAVRKMTSFPAQRVGLEDRGILRPGMKADIAVFDPARVRDRATYENPHQYPEGITVVLVNGVVVFENGAMTGARPGVVLYGPAALGGATKPAATASPTSSRHASSPPVRAAAWNPIFSSSRAARALDASSGQVQ
ncbi:MAG TPA: D-aminoacylase [Thermoanaerobaculia bacterium]|nr:D-aminoacylase [Thermoanaerobaculia bacterium]